MTDDELFDLDNEDLDSDEDPFAGATPAKAAVRTLEEFDAEVDRQIKILMSARNDPGQRRNAAYWLGESAAPKAISALRNVYLKDKKNKAVQQAAEYALGQFKALDEAIIREGNEAVGDALGKPENEDIVTLLESIALHDMRGKRLRIRTRTLVLIEVFMIVLLAGLVVLNLTLSPGQKADPNAKIAMRGEGSLVDRTLNELGLRVNEVKSDGEALRSQFSTAQSGQALNCQLKLQNPAEFTVNADVAKDYPTAGVLADRYNQFHADLTTARTTFDTACKADGKVASAAATTAMTTLSGLSGRIPAFLTDLDTAKAEVSLTATAQMQSTVEMKSTLDSLDATRAAATEEPTAVPTEEPTATPGMTSAELRTHTSELYALIDQATSQRGFNTLLNQYWTEIRDTGTTNSCRSPRPDIPDDYVLPEEVVDLVPDLQSAVQQVNTGLQTDRDGWDFFEKSCVNNTSLQNVNLGLNSPTLAKLAFDGATALLDQLGNQPAP